MQAFQRAAAVFGMACIGAELVSLFGGQGWAGRCIKAVAGLYILAVLLVQLPHLPGNVMTTFSGNTAPAATSTAQPDALETEILTETKAQLEEYCTVQCRQQFGLDIRADGHVRKKPGSRRGKKGCCCLPGLYRCTKTGGAQLFAADAGHRSYGGGGECTMKKNELLPVFRALQSGKNRTSLAVVVGVLAMLLLLLSELLPSGNTQKAAVSTAQTATVSQYQAQLEQQLEELISQLQGPGHTAVMVTLSTGEETCLRSRHPRRGICSSRRTHVLLQDGSALAETTYLPQVCGVARVV